MIIFKQLVFTKASVLMLGISIIWATTIPVIAYEPSSENIGPLFRQMKVIRNKPKPPPMDFILKDLEGHPVQLSKLKGEIVFLNFWASWCHECVAEMPSLEKLRQHFKGRNFLILAINLQEPRHRVKEFFDRHRLSFTALLDADGKVGKGFFIRAIPTSIILDKNGQMIGIALGPRKWDSEKSIALFSKLLDLSSK